MNLHQQLLTYNNCYKAKEPIKVQGVMWHSTGANNPNLRRYVQPDDGVLGKNPYNNDWNRAKPDGQSKCTHAFIGKDKKGAVATYQTLPWDINGWHCGGAANKTHIGFEICEDNLKNASYFNAVYKEACELTAYLCKKYNLDPMKDGVVICHSEGYKRGIASNHIDVTHWLKKHGKTMDNVRKDVKALMCISAPAPQPAAKPSSTSATTLYKVQTVASYSTKEEAASIARQMSAAKFSVATIKVGSSYKVQCGAYKVHSNALAQVEKLKAAGFKCAIY